MSTAGVDFEEYRDGILQLRGMVVQARTVAKVLVDNDFPAQNVRKRLYDAMSALQAAATYVDSDLIGKTSTDRQYERDLS
jgi:hypothetical protein